MQNLKAIKQIMLVAVLIISTIFGVASYFQYSSVKKELALYKENPTEAEAIQLIAQVGKLMELPTEEIPEVSTVKNVETLRADSFFKQAQNEDKVLSYKQRRILYRPSTSKIIEVQNMDITPQETTNESTTSLQATDISPNIKGISELIDSQKAQAEEETEITEPIKIALVNGTQSYAGLTGKAENYMKTRISEFPYEVVSKSDSVNTYERTQLVVNSELPRNVLDKLTTIFNAKIGQLPAEEKQIDSQIIVILGTAFVDINANELGY